jgi:hypothetical protein
MNRQGLGQLLAEAVQESERHAPSPDPVAALVGARRRAQRRRGHLATASFVVMVFVLQALPSDAFGSSPRSAVVVASHAGPAGQVQTDNARRVVAGGRG